MMMMNNARCALMRGIKTKITSDRLVRQSHKMSTIEAAVMHNVSSEQMASRSPTTTLWLGYGAFMAMVASQVTKCDKDEERCK